MKSKKPYLKQGDIIEIFCFVSKPDIFGNRYNSGQIVLNNKNLGDWRKNFGGKNIAQHNAQKILENSTNKPKEIKNFNYTQNDFKKAKIIFRIGTKENIPIKEFNEIKLYL
jgi:hypothetical protein